MDTETKPEACKHEPDWETISITWSHGTAFVDVNCRWCGISGCAGTSETLELIDW